MSLQEELGLQHPFKDIRHETAISQIIALAIMQTNDPKVWTTRGRYIFAMNLIRKESFVVL